MNLDPQRLVITAHTYTPNWMERMHICHIGHSQVTQQGAAAHDWMHFFSHTSTLGQAKYPHTSNTVEIPK